MYSPKAFNAKGFSGRLTNDASISRGLGTFYQNTDVSRTGGLGNSMNVASRLFSINPYFVASLIILLLQPYLFLNPIDAFNQRGVSNIFVNPIPGLPEDFVRGVDLSEVPWILELGGRFYDVNGVERDVLEIMKSSGVNWVRLRVWNNPWSSDGLPLGGGNCDLPRVTVFASRVKAMGFKLLINFHYSDWWADPSKQHKPRDWINLTFSELVETVYNWTKSALMYLSINGAPPDMVQVGNEIDYGFLWPEGRVENWDQFVTLLKSAIKAVRDSTPGAKVMIHLSGQHEPPYYVSFFDKLIGSGVDFDAIGLSYYTYMHGPLEKLSRITRELAQRFRKEVFVVETAYAWTLMDADGYPNIFGGRDFEVKGGYLASVQGQASLVRDVIETLFKAAGRYAGGVFYWGAAWIPVPGAGWRTGEGNPWENQALFDFEGRALPSINVFKLIYSDKPHIEPQPIGFYINQPIYVSTSIGAAPGLPKEVLVVYTDHSLRLMEVEWRFGVFNEPGLYRVLGRVNGLNDTIEAYVAVVNSTKLVIPDPLFDDNGVGTYGYPTNLVFKPGVFDIVKTVIEIGVEGVVIRVYLRDIGGNPWNAPNGFSLQFIQIYIRTSNPNVTRGLYRNDTYGLNLLFREDYAWQYAILLTPGWGYAPVPEGGLSAIYTSLGEVYVEDTDFQISVNYVENYIEAKAPLWVIRGWENPYEWRVVVASTSWDGLSPGGVRGMKINDNEWFINPVARGDEEFLSKVLEGFNNNLLPKVLDIQVFSKEYPNGVSTNEQHSWLMGFDPQRKELAVIPPKWSINTPIECVNVTNVNRDNQNNRLNPLSSKIVWVITILTLIPVTLILRKIVHKSVSRVE